jgi:hypothetical protein
MILVMGVHGSHIRFHLCHPALMLVQGVVDVFER